MTRAEQTYIKVLEVLQEVSGGEMSYENLADELNSRGITTARGEQWDKDRIYYHCYRNNIDISKYVSRPDGLPGPSHLTDKQYKDKRNQTLDRLFRIVDAFEFAPHLFNLEYLFSEVQDLQVKQPNGREFPTKEHLEKFVRCCGWTVEQFRTLLSERWFGHFGPEFQEDPYKLVLPSEEVGPVKREVTRGASNVDATATRP